VRRTLIRPTRSGRSSSGPPEHYTKASREAGVSKWPISREAAPAGQHQTSGGRSVESGHSPSGSAMLGVCERSTRCGRSLGKWRCQGGLAPPSQFSSILRPSRGHKPGNALAYSQPRRSGPDRSKSLVWCFAPEIVSIEGAGVGGTSNSFGPESTDSDRDRPHPLTEAPMKNLAVGAADVGKVARR
jgi:hypothetical protein